MTAGTAIAAVDAVEPVGHEWRRVKWIPQTPEAARTPPGNTPSGLSRAQPLSCAGCELDLNAITAHLELAFVDDGPVPRLFASARDFGGGVVDGFMSPMN